MSQERTKGPDATLCPNYRLPRWFSGQEPACQCRRWGFDPRVGKIAWRKKWQPTPYSCLGNPLDRGAWQVLLMGSQRVIHDSVAERTQCPNSLHPLVCSQKDLTREHRDACQPSDHAVLLSWKDSWGQKTQFPSSEGLLRDNSREPLNQDQLCKTLYVLFH